MIKILRRKFLAVILTMAFVISLLPALTLPVSAEAIYTAPTVTATGEATTFTQGGSSGDDLFNLVTAAVNDDGQTFSGAVFTVTNVYDTTEYLTVSDTDIALANDVSGSFSGGNYSVAVSGTTATVTLSDMTLDNAAMGTLIDGIAYKNSAASATVRNRTVTLTSVTDSGSNSAAPNIAATVKFTDFTANCTLKDSLGESINITGSSDSANPVIVTVDGTVTLQYNIHIKSGYVKIVGGSSGGTLLRGASMTHNTVTPAATQSSLVIIEDGTLTLQDVTLDGNKASVTANSQLVTLSAYDYTTKHPKLVLDSGAILQNNYNSNSNTDSIAGFSGTMSGTSWLMASGIGTLSQYSTITINSGSVIRWNTSVGYGAAIGELFSGSSHTINMTGGEIYGNLSGAVRNSATSAVNISSDGTLLSTFNMSGGKIYGNMGTCTGSSKTGAGVANDLRITAVLNFSGSAEVTGNYWKTGIASSEKGISSGYYTQTNYSGASACNVYANATSYPTVANGFTGKLGISNLTSVGTRFATLSGSTAPSLTTVINDDVTRDWMLKNTNELWWFIPVTSISNVPTTTSAGVNLALTGTVSPATAINKTITWSIDPSNALFGASVSSGSLVTTTAGTAKVLATITNGSGVSTDYTQVFSITVTSVGIGPTVTTQAVTSIKPTAATGNGNITALGSPNPTAYGVCWNTTGTPTVSDSRTDGGAVSQTGAFTASMTSLTAGTTYYVRAYATNTAGTSYGDAVCFTTSAASVPTVTTASVTTYDSSSATLGGNVTADGGAPVTERGVVYSSTDATPAIGESGVTQDTNGTGTDSFSEPITGLSEGTTYYVRAYATNTAGTSYGNVASFTTAVPTVTLSVDSATIAENAGVATVTATLSAVSANEVTVTLGYTGTATGSGTDYNASSATITIAAGKLSGTATITAANDTLDENDETVIADITGVINGTDSGTQQVTVTITDDDDAPTISVNDPSVAEGNSGTTSLTFTVTLSAVSGKIVTVDYATADGTATAGTDYTAISTTTLTFAAGETSKTVSVTVAGDTDQEAGETVLLNLTNPVNATISDSQGSGTISNDDTPSYGGGDYSPSSFNTDAEVIVNGKSQTAGTSQTTTNSSGQTTTTLTVDTDKLKTILDSQGSGATVTIPITGNSDVAAGTLTGAMVKSMEDKDATLVVQTASGTYTLPASEINIDAVSQHLGTNVLLSNINVTVGISEPSASMTQVVERAAQDGGFTIMVPAVDYTITCTHGSQTVNISSFNAFVERTIAIPDGVDATKITTAVVVDPDGTTHHVPTRVTFINGNYYAVINSLTNSTYSVVWNPIEFSDVTNHWAKDAINDMGSRMIVTGVGNNNYDPNRNMTRAEYAAIMVRALGLEPGTDLSGFDDVAATAWYRGYIETAASYGIIKGYDNGSFGPNDTITREQAMTMIARAMKITGLTVALTDSDISSLLGAYLDVASASDYAKDSIVACLKAGIISGTGNATVSPQADITRAEVAVMVQRLLQKSGLI